MFGRARNRVVECALVNHSNQHWTLKRAFNDSCPIDFLPVQQLNRERSWFLLFVSFLPSGKQKCKELPIMFVILLRTEGDTKIAKFGTIVLVCSLAGSSYHFTALTARLHSLHSAYLLSKISMALPTGHLPNDLLFIYNNQVQTETWCGLHLWGWSHPYPKKEKASEPLQTARIQLVPHLIGQKQIKFIWHFEDIQFRFFTESLWDLINL